MSEFRPYSEYSAQMDELKKQMDAQRSKKAQADRNAFLRQRAAERGKPEKKKNKKT